MSRRQPPEGRRTLCPRSCTTVRVELDQLKQAHERMAQDYGGFVLAVRPHLPPDLLAIADRILVEGFGVDRETLPEVTQPEPEKPSGLVVVGG